MNKSHWYCWTSIYNRFKSIKSRCNNPNSQAYSDYWWRWIKCLWKSFEDFLQDMWIPEEWFEIDRIDNNWHYCKENCRWANRIIQSRNKRSNQMFTFMWKTMCITDWAIEIWVNQKTLFKRLYDWKTFEEAITYKNEYTIKL